MGWISYILPCGWQDLQGAAKPHAGKLTLSSEYPLFKNPLSTFGAGARGEISTFLSTFYPVKRKKAGEEVFPLLLALCVILPG
jgi:hypothetical protein